MPSPFADADLSRVQRVFTDIDGTLTSGNKLRSATWRAVEQLREAGIPVVFVTGRPSGWAELFARMGPVEAVICENGGLYYAWRKGRLHKQYAQPLKLRTANRLQLMKHAEAAMKTFPGARLSMDSLATEVDLAIDHHEDVRLKEGTAARIEAFLRERGVTAVRSSVHVNFWLGRFNKQSAVKLYLRRELGTQLRTDDPRFLYAGDSFNDAPLFKAFTLSVGVANVADVLPFIPHPPRYVTRRAEGAGFEEIAAALLRSVRRK
jgi:HAD superfamily hydrolase (TIGR01484 family)